MKKLVASLIWKLWQFGWDKLGYAMVEANPTRQIKKEEKLCQE